MESGSTSARVNKSPSLSLSMTNIDDYNDDEDEKVDLTVS